jgi:hypothetical protein
VEHLLVNNSTIQKRPQPSQISQLLLAALQAKHEQCFRLLLQLPGVQQLQPVDFHNLLRRHFFGAQGEFMNLPQHHLLPVIVKHMPAAALAAPQINWTAPHNLIIAALCQRDCSTVKLYLERLPAAAAAIPPFRLARLLKAALLKCPAAFRLLSSLPAFQQLSSAYIAALLVEVVKTARRRISTSQSQPAAATRSAADDSEVGAFVQMLCGLPQAGNIQLSVIVPLLRGFLQTPGQPATDKMFDLLERSMKRAREQQQPEGQQQQQQAPGLSSDEVAKLLKSALPITRSGLPITSSGALAGLERLCSMQCVKDVADVNVITSLLVGALGAFCSRAWRP